MGEELSDLCVFLYSGSTDKRRKLANQYLIEKLGHPDEGSIFEKKLGALKYIFRVPVVNKLSLNAIKYLHEKGYDALMLCSDRRTIGHTAFQTHEDNSLHVFSTEIKPEYRGRGLSILLREKIIAYARQKQIYKVKLGAGGHPWSRRAYEIVSARKDELGIVPLGDYWIRVEEKLF